VRYYFGELFAFYFAWAGELIYTSFLPMIIGIAFFIAGISIRYLQKNDEYR
jgi:hypothetical protein